MRKVAAAPCIALDPDRYSSRIQSFEAQSAVRGCFDVGILVSPLLGVGIVTHGAQMLFGWFRGYGFSGTAFFQGLGGCRYVRSGLRLFADSREDIVRLYNEYRAGQFERVSVGSNGRNLLCLISPFFGFPFFSTGIDPLYSGPIFTAPTYITPDQTTQSIGDQTSEDLRSQVGQLTTEVQQLQAELAAARGQSTPTSAAAQNAPAVTLILKDGRRIEAAGYALVGSTFWILNAQDATKISLSDVDVDATQKENQKRGIHVVIPTNTSPRRLR